MQKFLGVLELTIFSPKDCWGVTFPAQLPVQFEICPSIKWKSLPTATIKSFSALCFFLNLLQIMQLFENHTVQSRYVLNLYTQTAKKEHDLHVKFKRTEVKSQSVCLSL